MVFEIFQFSEFCDRMLFFELDEKIKKKKENLAKIKNFILEKVDSKTNEKSF